MKSDFKGIHGKTHFYLCWCRLNPLDITLVYRFEISILAFLRWGISSKNSLPTVLQKWFCFKFCLRNISVDFQGRSLVFCAIGSHLEVRLLEVWFFSIVQSASYFLGISFVVIDLLWDCGHFILVAISESEVLVSVFLYQRFSLVIHLSSCSKEP